MGGLLSLGDDLLLEIVGHCPELGLTCRRLYGLYESHFRKMALKRTGARPDLIESLHNDCLALGLESWAITEYFARFDFWFFDSSNIVDLQHGDIKVSSGTNTPSELTSGIWREIEDRPWGSSLYAANVQRLHLHYATKLPPGRYLIHINVHVKDLWVLFPIRFSLTNTKNAKQHGSQFASISIGTTNSEFVSVARYLHTPSMFLAGNNSLSSMARNSGNPLTYTSDDIFETHDFCIGGLDVFENKTDDWTDISFDIEEVGSFVNRGIMFNYLFFESVPQETEVYNDWVMRPRRFKPTSDWRSLYAKHRSRLHPK